MVHRRRRRPCLCLCSWRAITFRWWLREILSRQSPCCGGAKRNKFYEADNGPGRRAPLNSHFPVPKPRNGFRESLSSALFRHHGGKKRGTGASGAQIYAQGPVYHPTSGLGATRVSSEGRQMSSREIGNFHKIFTDEI